jgi:hypothetical protein
MPTMQITSKGTPRSGSSPEKVMPPVTSGWRWAPLWWCLAPV